MKQQSEMYQKKGMPNPVKNQEENFSENSKYEKQDSIFGSIKRRMHYILLVFTIAAALSAGYFYNEIRTIRQDQNTLGEKQIGDVIKQVGELMILPEGELPTLATVTNPDQLKSQPFFEKAETGHKVLIYTNAKLAILYDPAVHKIVAVAPLNIGNK